MTYYISGVTMQSALEFNFSSAVRVLATCMPGLINPMPADDGGTDWVGPSMRKLSEFSNA